MAQSARLIEIDRIVRNSVDLAISGLSAEVLRSGRYDIILSPVAAGMLISTLTTPLSGENVYKGKSF